MKRVLAVTFALLMTAGLALANERGGRGPGGPGGDGGPGGGNMTVLSNGTVIVARVVTDSATDTSSTQLVAITSSGAQAWTATLANHRGGFVVAGSNLLTVSDTTPEGATTPQSTITALSSATGAQAWTLNVAGRITELEPFSGGTYAIVVTPATTTGGTATRRLVAISGAGVQLFSVNL